jgi:hypothetical protein
MNTGILLSSALLLLFQAAPSTLPTETGPLRNTFAVAVETVIDNASAVDLQAEDPRFNGQLQQLKSAKDNLARIAFSDKEKEIADSANNMVFLVSACRIQAKNGTNTTQCASQFASAQTRMMVAIDKHKSGASWVDGPPS